MAWPRLSPAGQHNRQWAVPSSTPRLCLGRARDGPPFAVQVTPALHAGQTHAGVARGRLPSHLAHELAPLVGLRGHPRGQSP